MLFHFAIEHLVTEDEAKRITGRLWPELTHIWVQAWALFKLIPEEVRRRIEECPIAKAGCLNALAWSMVKEQFADREADGLTVCDKLQFVKLYVTDRIVLRFNALSSDFVVRNIDASPQKDAYFRQEPLAGIWPSASRLTVGYLPDASKSELASVAMSLQVADDLVYHFPIDGQDAATVMVTQRGAPPQVPDGTMHSEKLRKTIH